MRAKARLRLPPIARAVAALLTVIVAFMVGCSGETGIAARAPMPASAKAVVLLHGLEPTEPPEPPASIAPTSGGTIPLPESRPVRVRIPAIGVDSGLLDLGLQDDGTLQVPPDGASAGWYTGGPTPGEMGPAVIVGHVDWGGELGVFYDLGNLKPQDLVMVTRADGSVAIFQVNSREQFPKDQFPTDKVYGKLDHAGLRLITCGGSFDRQALSYRDNIVIFADLVDSHAA